MKIRHFRTLFLINCFFSLFVSEILAQNTDSTQIQRIRIIVKEEGYEPSQFTVEMGKEVILELDYQADADHCINEFKSPALGIPLTMLKPNQKNEVRFMPKEAGTFGFSCGMAMFKGSVIVKQVPQQNPTDFTPSSPRLTSMYPVPKPNMTGKTVEYDLYIGQKTIEVKGRKHLALAINDQVPAPTLEFNEGDVAILRVHNTLNEESSIHWHGIILPPEMDGVSYINTAPIKAKSTHTFTFPLVQAGTYWYHSHTMLQEQRGLYGAIVVHPQKESDNIKEKVIVLSDWTNEDPHDIQHALKWGMDWYNVKKGSSQSYYEAYQEGYLKDRIETDKLRMHPMDISDVYYDAFWANGTTDLDLSDVQPNEKVKLRIVNGSASTYFQLQFAGGKMQVVEADGQPVAPIETDRLEIAVAETYDVVLTMPPYVGSYELRSTAWDISGFSSIWLGRGKKVSAPTIPKLHYFAMLREMNKMGDWTDEEAGVGFGKETNEVMTLAQADALPPQAKTIIHDMNHDTIYKGEVKGSLLTYEDLKAAAPTQLNTENPVRVISLVFTGNMRRYVWSFNGIPLSESDKIMIRKGETVRFRLYNATMMRHPFHLHGHFFRLLNGQGAYSPLKHTFDIKPMQEVTIEFLADMEKDWIFHCHILYHMTAGMHRIFGYEGTTSTQMDKKNPHLKEDKMRYPMKEAMLFSSSFEAMYGINSYHWQFMADAHGDWSGSLETEARFRRFLGKPQLWTAYFGAKFERDKHNDGHDHAHTSNEVAGFIGATYLLPYFIEADARFDTHLKPRLQLSRHHISLTPRLNLEMTANTDKEYKVELGLQLSKNWGIKAKLDNHFGHGIGITWRD